MPCRSGGQAASTNVIWRVEKAARRRAFGWLVSTTGGMLRILFERFTVRARDGVVLALEEARALRHNYIGTEHVLLGLMREEQGLGARVLKSLDVRSSAFALRWCG